MPADWTREKVCDVLVGAYRRLPSMGVYAPRVPSGLATWGQIEEALNWRRRFLPGDGRDWTYLLVWAERTAARESIRERVLENGWPLRRFDRGWRRAADKIAAGLNAEPINAAALQAGEAAEERLVRSGRIVLPAVPPRLIVTQGRRLTLSERSPDAAQITGSARPA